MQWLDVWLAGFRAKRICLQAWSQAAFGCPVTCTWMRQTLNSPAVWRLQPSLFMHHQPCWGLSHQRGQLEHPWPPPHSQAGPGPRAQPEEFSPAGTYCPMSWCPSGLASDPLKSRESMIRVKGNSSKHNWGKTLVQLCDLKRNIQ